MNGLDYSLTAAEPTMDDYTSNPNNKACKRRQRTASNEVNVVVVEEDHEQPGEGGDGEEVWLTFNRTFRQVQSVLDRNRALIQQVNENHQSKIADNMVKNVALIQEINGNISKVVSLYSDLSSDFSSAYHQQQQQGRDPNGSSNSNSNGSSKSSKGRA